MKLVEMKCKNCGAQLKVNLEQKHSYCQFCGAEFYIDDEVQHIKYDDMEQAGYEFEKGRIKAQQEENQPKGTFSMVIDDSFEIAGIGTVVTGKIDFGEITVGDTVYINNKITTVEKIQMFRKDFDCAKEGDTCGVFLKDISRSEIKKGDVLRK